MGIKVTSCDPVRSPRRCRRRRRRPPSAGETDRCRISRDTVYGDLVSSPRDEGNVNDDDDFHGGSDGVARGDLCRP